MGVIEIETEEEFKSYLLNSEGQNEKQYVFVDFYANWCGPCKRFSPVLDELSDQYNGNILYLKVNIDDISSIASKYSISSLPTFMIFETGSLTTDHEPIIGASRNKVEAKLQFLENGNSLNTNDDF